MNKIEQNLTWSEEDEKMGKELIDFCIKCSQGQTVVNSQNDFTRWTTWLKSLKDRYTWKPSDEQIEALKQAKTDAIGKPYYNALASLYINLK